MHQSGYKPSRHLCPGGFVRTWDVPFGWCRFATHLCVLECEQLSGDEEVGLGEVGEDAAFCDHRRFVPFLDQTPFERCLSKGNSTADGRVTARLFIKWAKR